MILDINKQLDEIIKDKLLQAEVITTECGKIIRFPNLDKQIKVNKAITVNLSKASVVLIV